ncbi:MAG TPA: NADH-quinone oxidoreductase subunit C [Gemmatimonadota bacterium]
MTAGVGVASRAGPGGTDARGAGRRDLAGVLRERFGDAVLGDDEFRGDLTVTVARKRVHDVLETLRRDPALDFAFLVDVTVVDWLLVGRLPRFEVVHHLYSFPHHRRIRIKTPVPEDDRWVPTATDLWKGADWLEREAWDMFGVVFDGHPNLRRILCHEDFEGHPLRKDFPADKRFFLPRPAALNEQAPAWVLERTAGRHEGPFAR